MPKYRLKLKESKIYLTEDEKQSVKTLINHKSVQKNYIDFKRTNLTEGIDIGIVKSLLLNEIKARESDPDRIKKLYRKLSYRLNNLKIKKDKALEHMVILILEEDSDFERKVTEMVEYLSSNKELKGFESKNTIIDRCLEIYYDAISRNKTHQEAALRSLLSIPFKIITKMNGLKFLKYAGILLLIGAFGEIVYNAVIVKAVGIAIIQLVILLVLFILFKILPRWSSFYKTILHS